MLFRPAVAAVPVLVLCAGVGLAQTTTPEGAAELKSSFETYLGTTPGVVTVSPEGDVYRVTIDLEPLAALIPAEGLSVDVSPYVYTLTDRGDGTWGVTENQPFSMTATIPGVFDMNYRIGSITSEGIWDPSLRTFTTYEATMTDTSIATKSYLPDGTLVSDDLQSIATGRFDVTGVPAAAGGVDITATLDYTGYRQTVSLPPVVPDAPMQQVVITADTYGGTSTASGLRTVPMFDIMAWMVEKGSAEAITGAQAELKPLLLSALPVWNNLSGDLRMTNLSAESPVGTFAASSAVFVIDVNGLVAEGKYRLSTTFEGVTTPAGLVPDWAVELVPTSMTIDMAASRFNLAEPARIFIEAIDLTRPDIIDPAVESQFLSAFLPGGTMDVVVGPSRVTGPIFDIAAEGQLAVGPGQLPVGTARVTASGLDRVQAVLQAAPPEVSGQFLMPLGMATGLARTEADGRLAWDIEMTPTGSVLINGMDLGTGAPAP